MIILSKILALSSSLSSLYIPLIRGSSSVLLQCLQYPYMHPLFFFFFAQDCSPWETRLEYNLTLEFLGIKGRQNIGCRPMLPSGTLLILWLQTLKCLYYRNNNIKASKLLLCYYSYWYKHSKFSKICNTVSILCIAEEKESWKRSDIHKKAKGG